MHQKKVIVTDFLHPYLADWLVDKGFQVDIQETITNDELFSIIENYEGLVLSTKIKVTPTLIDKAKNLEFIARAGSGMENIDVAYSKSKGIHVVNSPEGNANAVAEHAVGMTLALLNNIVKSDAEIRNGVWQREPNRGEEIKGKTIGIIGYGHTGSRFAAKWGTFGVTILAHDKYKSGFGTTTVVEASVEDIWEKAEIISFHLPLNAETQFYCNAAFINKMKRPFWLINTSRGKIVNTANLIEGLDQGKILGAALDVFENEKFYQLEGTDLAQMQNLTKRHNIILTPHVAGWTHTSHLYLSKILAEKLDALGIQSVK
ncbi:MAG: hydroxyacid dehydrogenase [Chitinophagales bacterium]|jgi:D-3-phosphoglycerate dehydrogenase|nr:hydroxyacid dehydrogenase [Chitinophagales bacterium]